MCSCLSRTSISFSESWWGRVGSFFLHLFRRGRFWWANLLLYLYLAAMFLLSLCCASLCRYKGKIIKLGSFLFNCSIPYLSVYWSMQSYVLSSKHLFDMILLNNRWSYDHKTMRKSIFLTHRYDQKTINKNAIRIERATRNRNTHIMSFVK